MVALETKRQQQLAVSGPRAELYSQPGGNSLDTSSRTPVSPDDSFLASSGPTHAAATDVRYRRTPITFVGEQLRQFEAASMAVFRQSESENRPVDQEQRDMIGEISALLLSAYIPEWGGIADALGKARYTHETDLRTVNYRFSDHVDSEVRGSLTETVADSSIRPGIASQLADAERANAPDNETFPARRDPRDPLGFQTGEHGYSRLKVIQGNAFKN